MAWDMDIITDRDDQFTAIRRSLTSTSIKWTAVGTSMHMRTAVIMNYDLIQLIARVSNVAGYKDLVIACSLPDHERIFNVLAVLAYTGPDPPGTDKVSLPLVFEALKDTIHASDYTTHRLHHHTAIVVHKKHTDRFTAGPGVKRKSTVLDDSSDDIYTNVFGIIDAFDDASLAALVKSYKKLKLASAKTRFHRELASYLKRQPQFPNTKQQSTWLHGVFKGLSIDLAQPASNDYLILMARSLEDDDTSQVYDILKNRCIRRQFPTDEPFEPFTTSARLIQSTGAHQGGRFEHDESELAMIAWLTLNRRVTPDLSLLQAIWRLWLWSEHDRISALTVIINIQPEHAFREFIATSSVNLTKSSVYATALECAHVNYSDGISRIKYIELNQTVRGRAFQEIPMQVSTLPNGYMISIYWAKRIITSFPFRVGSTVTAPIFKYMADAYIKAYRTEFIFVAKPAGLNINHNYLSVVLHTSTERSPFAVVAVVECILLSPPPPPPMTRRAKVNPVDNNASLPNAGNMIYVSGLDAPYLPGITIPGAGKLLMQAVEEIGRSLGRSMIVLQPAVYQRERVIGPEAIRPVTGWAELDELQTLDAQIQALEETVTTTKKQKTAVDKKQQLLTLKRAALVAGQTLEEYESSILSIATKAAFDYRRRIADMTPDQHDKFLINHDNMHPPSTRRGRWLLHDKIYPSWGFVEANITLKRVVKIAGADIPNGMYRTIYPINRYSPEYNQFLSEFAKAPPAPVHTQNTNK